MSRFKDENLTLYYFSEKILVHCPKCNKKAQVYNHLRDGFDAEISCSNCGYYLKNDKEYFSLKFRRNCPECGKEILLSIDKVKNKSMKIPCNNCNFNENYEPIYIKHRHTYGDIEKGKDYFFNADLWLKKEYKGNLFWSTNYEHLEYLKKNIQAKIRERNNRTFMTK